MEVREALIRSLELRISSFSPERNGKYDSLLITQVNRSITKKFQNREKAGMINTDHYHNDMDSGLEDGCAEKSMAEMKRQTQKERRSINKLRAREARKRKKMMVEGMRNKIVLLTIQNENLRKENQMQQNEIILLRKKKEVLSYHRVSSSFFH